MTGGYKRFLLIVALLGLAACDAGPSVVLKDGEGKAASSPVAAAPVAEPKAPAEPIVSEQAAAPEPEHQNAGAPNFGKPLPIAADRATVTATRYGDWPLWSSNRKYST